MEKENYFMKMGICMKGILENIISMVLEFTLMPKAVHTKDNEKIQKNMEKEQKLFRMEAFMKEDTTTVKNKVKENLNELTTVHTKDYFMITKSTARD